jgi:hypothetical protein
MERCRALPGDLVVRSVDVAGALERSLDGEFGVRPAMDRSRGRVTVRGSDSDDPPARMTLTGDAGDGLVVGTTDRGLVVSGDWGWYELAGTVADLFVNVPRATAPWRAIRDVIRPAIQVAGLEGGAAVVHGAAVRMNGRGTIIAGWSESGKTETALALRERGATFIGDKWTAVWRPATDGGPRLGPFPSRVGIRGWVLPFLPTLERDLPAGARTRIRAGSVVAGIGRRVAGAAARSRLAEATLGPTGRTAALADTIRLPSDSLRPRPRAGRVDPTPNAPGPRDDGAELAVLALLTTVEAGGRPSIEDLDPSSAARELAISAAYERRAYHLLGQRAAQLGSFPVPGFGVTAQETQLLESLLQDVRMVRIRVPFPVDPSIAAELLATIG